MKKKHTNRTALTEAQGTNTDTADEYFDFNGYRATLEEDSRLSKKDIENTIEKMRNTIEEIKNKYIAKYDDDANFQDIVSDNPELIEAVNLDALHMLIFKTSDMDVLKKLKDDPRIKYINKDGINTVDPV